MNTAGPLYVQIQEFVRLGIQKGYFREGDRLPSEHELAERFDTTRATVAKALQQLVFERVISRRSGSGTFVGSGRIEDRVDTTLLESFEDHVLAAGETLQYELVGFESVNAPADTAERLGLEPGAPAYRLERLRLISGRLVALELRYLPPTLGKGIREEWLRKYSIQDVLRDCLGLRIGRIENAVSASTAPAATARTLKIRKGDALLVREHLIVDPQGRPLLHGRTLYPGDFSIRYTLRAPPGKG